MGWGQPSRTAIKHLTDPVRVATYGGDSKRVHLNTLPGIAISKYSSAKYNRRAAAKLAASIRRGGVDLVIILTRWADHTGQDKVIDACKKHGVPHKVAHSGASSSWVNEFLASGEYKRCLDNSQNGA